MIYRLERLFTSAQNEKSDALPKWGDPFHVNIVIVCAKLRYQRNPDTQKSRRHTLVMWLTTLAARTSD